MSIDDDGGFLDFGGSNGLWGHFRGWLGWGLGAKEGRDGEEQGCDGDSGSHRLCVSIERQCRE